MSWKYILPACLIWSPPLVADEAVPVQAPIAIIDTGLMQHLMPRFSLKTGIALDLVDADGAVVIGAEGRPVMQGLGQVWHVDHDARPGAARFAEWLVSEVGQRTITSFTPDRVAPFGPPPEVAAAEAVRAFAGDPTRGLEVSETHCSRCHSVVPGKRLNDISSTPSFLVLRALPDWPERFAAFFALNPHPAFTQIDDVTPPFPLTRPSPIAPIEMTLEDLDAVMAYVAGLQAADLGADLVHQ